MSWLKTELEWMRDEKECNDFKSKWYKLLKNKA